MALLPLTDDLIRTSPADAECAALADRHYSRGKVGSNQFMGNGRKIVLRDTVGSVVFGWLWCLDGLRRDGELGYNCAIFRNESAALASDLILEAEGWALKEWGPNRAFTYIDPRYVKPTMFRGYPVFGWSFYKAGWRYARVSKDGKHILHKQLGKE